LAHRRAGPPRAVTAAVPGLPHTATACTNSASARPRACKCGAARSVFPEAALARFEPWAWIVFGGVLLGLLVIDLAVHRGARARSRSAAIVWSCIWVGVGLAFTLFVWWRIGGAAAQEYLAAYLVEKSLSLDNLFVFLVIFRSLNIPHAHQRTVLSWGIFGALVFRAVFVVLGVAAIERYHWIVYVFA